MSIELRAAEVSRGFKSAEDKRVRKDFLEVVDGIYRDDPNYVRPLDLELKDRLSPKNPFFLHAEGVLFVAYRGGVPVGRCTAQIDHEHLARHHDGAGFFGFLDTIDDPDVTRALLAGAEKWLRERGMERARGPLSLSINEETGCLVDGFTTPPMLMMPHNRNYQGGLIEAAGYAKLKDVFAWQYFPGEVPRRARQAAEAIKQMPEVTNRQIDVKNIESDIRIGMDIFNDAWADNWGFVPMTEPELKKMASDFKLVLVPELTQIVSIDGKPAGICVCLPNLNEITRDFGGKINPVNLARLVWRFKVLGPSQARVILLGIRREYRHVRKYAGLSAYMYTTVNEEGRKLGIRSAELSWTLEDNGPVNAGIKLMGGKVYKTYRIYERALTAGAKSAAGGGPGGSDGAS